MDTLGSTQREAQGFQAPQPTEVSTVQPVSPVEAPAPQVKTPEQESREVNQQIEQQLDARNQELGGNLFIKMSTRQSEGAFVSSMIFDAPIKRDPANNDRVLVATSEGFRIITAEPGKNVALHESLRALRNMAENPGTAENRFIGNVNPGHNSGHNGAEEFFLPDGVIAKSDEGPVTYTIATEQDVQELLPKSVTVAEQIHAIRLKAKEEADKKNPTIVAKKLLPNLGSLLRPAATPEATPTPPPAPIAPPVA